MGKLPAFVEPECSSLCYQTPVNGLRSEEVTGPVQIFLIICHAWNTNVSLLPKICLYFASQVSNATSPYVYTA